jgi:molecular chaperone GrpE
MIEEKRPHDQGAPAGAEGPTESDELSSLREQLQEALREKDQFRAMAQRAQADLINYKRRVAEESEELRRSAKAQVLSKTLSVVDDMQRALAMAPEDVASSGWLEGLRLVQRNLESVLTSEGVRKIEAEGQPFAPWEHEAVLFEPSPGGKEGTVIKVIRDGYKLYDKVLRPAQVTVSKALENKSESSSKEA